jgi:hypothetical protein
MVVSNLKEIMEYHPDNPNGENLVAAYNNIRANN